MTMRNRASTVASAQLSIGWLLMDLRWGYAGQDITLQAFSQFLFFPEDGVLGGGLTPRYHRLYLAQ